MAPCRWLRSIRQNGLLSNTGVGRYRRPGVGHRRFSDNGFIWQQTSTSGLWKPLPVATRYAPRFDVIADIG
jgi:hypothetical protein